MTGYAGINLHFMIDDESFKLVSPSLDEPTSETEWHSDLATLSQLKADPGRVGLASVLKEIVKPERINDTQLPDNLFRDIPQKILERYRLRVSTWKLHRIRARWA